MKTRACLAAWLCVATTAWAQAPPAVDVGDKAPPLKIKDWVKGQQVDLAKDAAKKLHLVEFWATWCAPCKASVPLLTEFQKKYAKDLVIVSITDLDEQGNTAKAINKFVEQQGPRMEYTVAIDDNGVTTTAYMGRGAVAIPQAFLVGREGVVLWQGSPLDEALRGVLDRAIAGKLDVSAAKRERSVNDRLRELSVAVEMQQWGVVWDGLVEVLKMDPAHELAMQSLVSLYANELHNTTTFRSWGRSHIDANGQNVTAMRLLAETLMQPDDLARRSPDLALEAAKAAYEASNRKDAAAVATYAQVVYQLGEVDRAIVLQEAAVALASSEERKRFQQVLEFYRLCDKLGASVE